MRTAGAAYGRFWGSSCVCLAPPRRGAAQEAAEDGVRAGRSADEVARELANPNATLRQMGFPIDYIRYGGDLPGAGDETVPSVTLLDDSPIATLADGWLVSATVNVAWPPASVVGPLGGETVMPAVSLSVFVIDTSTGLSPL